jgi:hypothetical protein
MDEISIQDHIKKYFGFLMDEEEVLENYRIVGVRYEVPPGQPFAFHPGDGWRWELHFTWSENEGPAALYYSPSGDKLGVTPRCQVLFQEKEPPILTDLDGNDIAE